MPQCSQAYKNSTPAPGRAGDSSSDFAPASATSQAPSPASGSACMQARAAAYAPARWVFRAAVALIITSLLALALLPVVSNLQAKYLTGTSGGDSARVAKFEFSGAGEQTQGVQIDVAPSAGSLADGGVVAANTEGSQVEVANTDARSDSDATVANADANASANTEASTVNAATIQIANKGEVSLTFTVSCVNKTGAIPVVSMYLADAAGGSVLAPGETQTYTLQAYWPASGADDLKYSGMVDYYEVTICAQQAD